MNMNLIEDIAYMDPDNKYRDWGTGNVSSDLDIFSDKTGTSDYDSAYRNPKEAEYHNWHLYITKMTPAEYYEECANRIFVNSNTSIDSLKRQRGFDKQTFEELKEIVLKYHKRLFMPYLNYADHSQEGLHRMFFAGEVFGWDKEFPVLIIEIDDWDRKRKEDKEKKDREYRLEIRNAVHEAVKYEYPRDKFLEYFKIQIEDEIEKSYRLESEQKDVAIENLTIDLNDKTQIVTITTYMYSEEYELSAFRISAEEDEDYDFELTEDDFEIGDIEDFLSQYIK